MSKRQKLVAVIMLFMALGTFIGQEVEAKLHKTTSAYQQKGADGESPCANCDSDPANAGQCSPDNNGAICTCSVSGNSFNAYSIDDCQLLRRPL
ncbi:hypothetical protein SAMN05216436_102279 [bacterium A37T11]|nr:hypothetical protein SAMN05216436_102279 [bacterium A37T11]